MLLVCLVACSVFLPISCGLSAVGSGVVRDFTVSEDLAAEIGEAVLKDVFGDNIVINRQLLVEEYWKNKNYWCVSLSFPKVPGGAYCVAIDKNNGKILKVWMDE